MIAEEHESQFLQGKIKTKYLRIFDYVEVGSK